MRTTIDGRKAGICDKLDRLRLSNLSKSWCLFKAEVYKHPPLRASPLRVDSDNQLSYSMSVNFVGHVIVMKQN